MNQFLKEVRVESMQILGNSIIGRRNSKRKVPEKGLCLVCSRTRKEPGVAGAEGTRWE